MYKIINFCGNTIDFYARGPQSKLKGRHKYFSYYGFVISAFIIIFLFALFIIYFIQLVEFQNPSLAQSQYPQSTVNDSLYILTENSTFQMGFALVNIDTGVAFIDEKIYTVQAKLEIINKDSPDIIIDLELENCTEKHFPDAEPQTYLHFLCFKQQDDLFVRTFRDTRIAIIFSRCNSDNCYENADTIIASSVWGALYTLWAINPSSHEHPLLKTYSLLEAGLPRNTQRWVKIPLLTLGFSSDNGWLVPTSESQSAITTEKVDYDVFSFSDTDVLILTTIWNSGNKTVCQRSYMRLPLILAQIQGLLSLLIPFFGLFVIPYLPFATLRMYQHPVNDIYQIKIGQGLDREKKKDAQNEEENALKSEHQQIQENETNNQGIVVAPADNQISQTLELATRHESQSKAPPTDPNKGAQPPPEALTNKSNKDVPTQTRQLDAEDPNKSLHDPVTQNGQHSTTSNLNEIAVHIPNNEIHQEDTQSQQQAPESLDTPCKPIDLSFFVWIKSLFRHEPEVRLLSQAVEEIEETIDQVTIIKKLIEVERLKICLFNENQRVLFENLGKPLLCLDKKEDKGGTEENHGKEKKHACWGTLNEESNKAPEEVYKELKQKESQTDLDQRLLLLYEKTNQSPDQKKKV